VEVKKKKFFAAPHNTVPTALSVNRLL